MFGELTSFRLTACMRCLEGRGQCYTTGCDLHLCSVDAELGAALDRARRSDSSARDRDDDEDEDEDY